MQKPKRQEKYDFGNLGKATFDELELPSGAKAKGITIDTGNDAEDIKLAKELLGGIQSSAPATITPAVESAKLAMVSKKYRLEKVAEGSWTPKTAAEHEALYELLIQIVGNVEISTVTHKAARDFKDCLMKLPPNMGKGIYAGKTAKQVVAMNPKERMATNTFNGKIQRVSSRMIENFIVDGCIPGTE